MLSLLATTMVVCAPGFPGSAAEAQPAMDAFARALAQEAKWAPGALVAAYDETDLGGVAQLEKADASVALVTLPFFLAHEEDLHLTARMMAQPKGSKALQRWTLVAQKGAPASLVGYAVQSSAGPPRFVRAVAQGVPKDAVIATSGAVLSGLRRAANGEKLALVLDGAQASALGTLPFAPQLEPLGTSPEVPIALIATVGKRLDERAWKTLEAALGALARDPAAREALDGVQMDGFVPLDAQALQAARAAYQKAP